MERLCPKVQPFRKVHLIRQGGEDIESRSLESQQPPSLAVFFGSPPLLLVLKYTNFWIPLIFSEPPLRVAKNVWSPHLNIFIPPCHIK